MAVTAAQIDVTENRQREYWDHRLHDQEMSAASPGSTAWYADLAAYRYEKLDYLFRLVDFGDYRNKDVLEVGCGVGLDLALFARAGARATGIDLSSRAVELARTYLIAEGLDAPVLMMNGEQMAFKGEKFDVVYAHGCLPYAENPSRVVAEIARVLRPGGIAILMFYHRRSWLPVMSRLTGVALEHSDAPFFRTHERAEVRRLLNGFQRVRIIGERFPVRSRLHHGWKAVLYNGLFVPTFRMLPRALVRRWGWHLIVWAEK